MIHPTPGEFARLSGQYGMVPCWLELPADLETPLSVFLKLRGDGPSFLLESVEGGEVAARYSILGTRPMPLLRCWNDRVEYWDGKCLREESRGDLDALDWLRKVMAPWRRPDEDGLPPFWGGAVGYLAYDAIRGWERLGTAPSDDLELPDAHYLLSHEGVVFDHVRQRMFLYSICFSQAEADYVETRRRLEAMREQLARPLQVPSSEAASAGEVRSNRTQADFESAVQQAQQAIAAGEVFQMVLSQRLEQTTSCDAVTLYRALRLTNPSPYMMLLDFGSYQLIGASPEMLVRLQDGMATTRPIAGTRRRGENEAEDLALEQELLADPKERAEHVMLVDLGRNDVGRVSEFGSVSVPQFLQVERFSSVMHLVSRVQGKLSLPHDGLDLLRAAFPAGTVSGAPKIRAMQLIDTLEPTRRGPYAGSVGMLSFAGDVNTCITIRTMLKIGERLLMQAGAGIVADSDPTREYQETLDKLGGLRRAVELAQSGWLQGGNS